MKSFSDNYKNSLNSLTLFIHEGTIIESENQFEEKINRDSFKESFSETAENVQNKDKNSDLTDKNHDSFCGHFF